ncbi:restriction endonuclease subunit S [Vibrio sp. CUB2]|uniref:restriction endonuclease subunit S n=1 Tax=Vibrio sp. CUB2 TaxID=2315233 RepID=UPI00076A5222|nr:restriction endonuclease subunit S [Vibrio sp. CUB2]
MAGRYKAYPETKESGTKFLDALPTHWNISKVRFIATFGRGLAITKANLQDTGVPCVSYGEVHSKYGFEVDPKNHPLKCVSEEYLTSSPYALLSKGDFIFADTSEDIDGSGNFTQLISDEALFAGYHTVIVRPEPSNHYRFIAYLFDSSEFRAQVRDTVKGVKVFSITQAILKNASVWLPPIEEQQKIANFLDHEIAKINNLIAKQEKLIRLLKEKRQVTISHAVTKGINPNAPMRDSGVEWIGDVPEHWDVKKFKYIFKIRKRIAGGTGYDVLSITQKGIKVKDITSGEGQLSLDYSKYQLVYVGDFAMNHMDLLTGFVDISKHEGVTSPDYRVFTLEHKSSEPNYYLRLLQMGYHDKLFYPLGQGAAHLGRWRLPTEAFNEFLAPCPPYNEQKEISCFINNTHDRIDALLEKAEDAVMLMKEKKLALISAAVTGRIDLRDWSQK